MSLITTITHAWTGHYEPHGKIEQADCVIGFSFGYRGKASVDGGLSKQDSKNGIAKERKVQPGLSNQDLANVAIKSYTKLPKILQFEIADAYMEADGPQQPAIIRIEKHRKRHTYLDTVEVAEQAKIIMEENGWKNAVLLAHPNHMPRADAVCKNLGISTIVTRDEVGTVEFDPLSSQKWTRNIDKWRGYEPLAICFYKLKGYL